MPHDAVMFRRLGCFLLVLLGGPGAPVAAAGDPAASATPPPSPFAAWLAAPPGPNHVALLENGYESLILRLHLIRAARRSIDLQTFIWSNDASGRLMFWELLQAARRGVRVRLLADQPFSERDPAVAATVAAADPNLEVRHYRPIRSRLDPSLLHTLAAAIEGFEAVNQRMHNKVLVIDDAVLITGGRNLEDAYFDRSPGLNYRDRDVIAAGPVAAAAGASFLAYWESPFAVPSRALKDVAAVFARGEVRRPGDRSAYDFGPDGEAIDRAADDVAGVSAGVAALMRPVRRAEFVADIPGKGSGFFTGEARITRELRETLLGAEDDILIQTPYLVLSPAARALLKELRTRRPGLRVRISTNSLASTDNLLAYSGNFRLRGTYVGDLALAIHEFKPHPASRFTHIPRLAELERLAERRIAAGEQRRGPFLCLHAKSLVVDRRLAFVGSYNLDPRSERLNTEAGLLIEDEAFAAALRGAIEDDLRPENSWVIARREYPLGLGALNALIDGLISLTPVDLWPLENTSSFELKPDGEPHPPGAASFHRHYRDVGSFPGTEGLLSRKEILTLLYKTVGKPLTPML